MNPTYPYRHPHLFLSSGASLTDKQPWPQVEPRPFSPWTLEQHIQELHGLNFPVSVIFLILWLVGDFLTLTARVPLPYQSMASRRARLYRRHDQRESTD